MYATQERSAVRRPQAYIDMPLPKFPIGTRLDLSKLPPARRAQLTKQFRNAIVRRARKDDDLRREYYGTVSTKRQKLPTFDKNVLRNIFKVLQAPDTVVVSGHIPLDLMDLRAVVHQAMLKGALGLNGNFGYCIVFRKNVDGTEVVYACSELLDEADAERCAIRQQ